jgi:periplasmic protein CpxP/Spy
MKLFKALAVAALLISGTVAMAQAPQGGQGQRQRMSSAERAKTTVDKMTEVLALTAEQKTKATEIELKYAAKDSVRMAGMMANQGQDVDREAMMAEMQKTREAKNAEQKAILTDAQKTKFDAYLQENPRGFSAGGFGGMGGGAPRN